MAKPIKLPPLPEPKFIKKGEIPSISLIEHEYRMREYGQQCATAAIEADRQARGKPVGWIAPPVVDILRDKRFATICPTPFQGAFPVYLAHPIAEPVGNVSKDSAIAHMRINLPEGTPLYATPQPRPEASEPVARAAIYDRQGRRQFQLNELGTKAAASLPNGVHDLYTSQQPQQIPEGYKKAIQKAYGHLWMVNNEPGTPHQYSPEEAAYKARRLLRELLTKEERGDGINSAMLEAAPEPKGKV